MSWFKRFPGRFALAALLATAVVPTAFAYDTGPPDNVAANPPYYFNCTLCHNDYEVNSGDGSVAITAPAAYTPGSTYHITVTLRDPGQQRWGFELAAQDEAQQQAGAFTITDSVNTQLSSVGFGLPDFVKQTQTGTYEHTFDGPVSWSFDWTAGPSAMATFYVSSNAANDDYGQGGDYIYTDSLVVTQGVTATEAGTWSHIKSLFR